MSSGWVDSLNFRVVLESGCFWLQVTDSGYWRGKKWPSQEGSAPKQQGTEAIKSSQPNTQEGQKQKASKSKDRELDGSSKPSCRLWAPALPLGFSLQNISLSPSLQGSLVLRSFRHLTTKLLPNLTGLKDTREFTGFCNITVNTRVASGAH